MEFSHEETLKLLKNTFDIKEFRQDQIDLITEFCKGRNIFLSAHTGYGKSIVYQAIPWYYDEFHGQALGTSTLLVISPLISLMEDQVAHLKQQTGISVVAINKDTKDLDKKLNDIEQGIYSLVYTSPESMLSKLRLRQMLSCNSFREHCIGIVIDEAHVIAEWGFADHQKRVFRKWYANLVEFKALLDGNISFALFTATASRLMEIKIFESLGLSDRDFYKVSLNPDRKNIVYSVQLVPKIPFAEIFGFVIEDIRANKDNSKRRLIYCQTRKQCALIFNMFCHSLGSLLYKDQVPDPKGRLVDMFHGGTPHSVKANILTGITSISHLRVVVCTIAFGMGVNCKGVCESIHFGPSKSITSLVQESGRIGRDGTASISRIFYNSSLLSKVDSKVKEFVTTSSCRRKVVLSVFQNSSDYQIECGCLCCDNCLSSCECDREQFLNKIDFYAPNVEKEAKTRMVCSSDLELLKECLIDYSKTFLHFTTESVSLPNLYVEFDETQVKHLIDNADKIFTIQDVFKYGQVWRRKQAVDVIKIFEDVFQDTAFDNLSIQENTMHTQTSMLGEEWHVIANDTSIVDSLSDSFFAGKIDTAAALLDEE